jgi:hypothetical protein
VTDDVADEVAVTDGVCDDVTVLDEDAVWLPELVHVLDGVAVVVLLADCVLVVLEVAVAAAVSEAVTELLAVGDELAVLVSVWLVELVELPVGVFDAVVDCVAVTDDEAVCVGETLGVPDWLGVFELVTVLLPVTLGNAVRVPLTVPLVEGVPV